MGSEGVNSDRVLTFKKNSRQASDIPYQKVEEAGICLHDSRTLFGPKVTSKKNLGHTANFFRTIILKSHEFFVKKLCVYRIGNISDNTNTNYFLPTLQT